ncbi:MAG: hypothetical protein JRG97_14165 [Deltaproteobacteria bacterium]|nr:hypothetical protein [Deltaproteobacteria bacterium]MBW2053627.1 hypothetical protein [Deltaproteobacteria bacterium]MBW2142186.1 hypothetical protein [Deltaproteobacteria bacterium]MBW2324163.1 hypothetical protein [Deltaproteobacteria bacterium]
MGLNPVFIYIGLTLVGLFSTGWGLGRESALGIVLAPMGWIIFLIGLANFLVPGFFGS